jgi:hypothetical protein
MSEQCINKFRSFHHHVFDKSLAIKAVLHAEFEVATVEPLLPYHIVVLARNPIAKVAASLFDEDSLREALRESPFLSDRQGS